MSTLSESPAEHPRRIMVAGDWHGNTRWAVHVIEKAARLLLDEPERIVLQLGDFGIWPGQDGADYVAEVEQACAEHSVQVWFIDGNHEDFTQVHLFDPWQSRYRYLTHLPRGHRWTWHDRTWLALGGGVSLDRAIRTEGRDWWPQEEITADEVDGILDDGPADVMVTHDCPQGVTHSFPPPPSFWALRDIARSDAHRELLQRVTSAVQPGHLMHGHLHRAYQRTCDFGYGPVGVTGLDSDGTDGNWAVLDVKQMTWARDTERKKHD